MARTKSRFPEKNLNFNINFMVTKDLKQKIDKRCDDLGLSTSEYLREIILKDVETKEG